MKKMIVFACILLLVNTPQLTTITAEETDNLNLGFCKSIELYGKVQFTKQLIHIPIGEKSLIMYMSMNLIYGSEVTVKINNEIFNFDYAGTIKIIGFYGTYNDQEDTDKNDGKTYINLNGKALYATIEGKQFEEVDESYVSIVESLDTITHPLNKSPLQLSDEDLESLSYLSESKIVGLGEATHGTKEFFQLKHRIFRYLVENHDFNIFAFECDIGESYYVDKYVTKGIGDIDDIMINKMHFWVWRTEEVKNLLLWMKEYNEDKSDEEKIHFIGVDCQFLTHQPDIIIDYFNQTHVILSDESLEFLKEINQINPVTILEYYTEMSLGKKEEIDQNVDKLLGQTNQFKDDLISASSEYEYQFIIRIILNIKQVNDFFYLYAHDTDFSTSYGASESYMAKNTFWTSTLFGDNTKVAIWAHNGHITNVANDENIYPSDTMGFHLKEALNDKYQIVGFAFSFGSFTVVNLSDNNLGILYMNKEPLFDSINYIFHYAQDKNFILRESDIYVNSEFDIWISRPHKLLSIGSGYDEEYLYYFYLNADLKAHYDVLIYWDITTASELLDPSNSLYCVTTFPFYSERNLISLKKEAHS